MAKQNRWGRKIGRGAASWTLLVFLLWVTPPSRAQTEGGSIKPSDANVGTPGGTSTDLFVGLGSDFDRPGLLPRANYGIGIGHTFGFLKKDPVGDELTFAYTYENAGTHGFLHTDFGEDTESVGVMKSFALPKVKLVSGYTWIQGGITSYTGNANVRNRFDSSASLGVVVHLSYHSSIWIQESYNKVVTVPWYSTSSVSYTYSW
jgi:hypothetical protein